MGVGQAAQAVLGHMHRFVGHNFLEQLGLLVESLDQTESLGREVIGGQLAAGATTLQPIHLDAGGFDQLQQRRFPRWAAAVFGQRFRESVESSQVRERFHLEMKVGST